MTTEGSGKRTTQDGEPTVENRDRPSASVDAGTPFARFARPRTDAETTLAVVADPHVSTERDGTWKVFHRTEDRLRAALADANARDVDGVVFAGDLTEDGRPADFERVADLLKPLRVPAVAVPGNHDVPKAFKDHDTPPVSEFADRFAPDEFPFRERLGGVDVVGLNSSTALDGSLDATHGGAISDDQLDWLDAALADADAPLVVTHHNLAGLDACVGDEGYAPHPPVEDAEEFTRVLAHHDALHVSGHVHLPAVTRCEARSDPTERAERESAVSSTAKSERQRREQANREQADSAGVHGVVCPALSSFPQAYLLVEVGPEGTTVRFVPVADSAGVTEAYELARSHSDRSRDVAEMVERQLAALPLVDER